MRIVISVLAILFGGLHLIAGLSQSKSQDPAARGFAIAMACGGICVASEAVANLVGSNPGWLDALAYANGSRSGNFHLSHHIVRALSALLLTAGTAIW